ncbi:HlyD family secretion protein [Ginsengibacter hankyongi]|uniref:HlyD family secretion protein n=1 Tax=Ginsengibacter hankyongi TaxID=2607284 RepID=A0A5J5IIT3_9BACT|nr:HlyD family secretion protein [Ginsengibacter hankyongi]KAA9039523.1 HlyD family secretion protein [Ginsengibacter hankyongi]
MESKDNEKIIPADSLTDEPNGKAEPKKKSKVFLIILIVMILGGGWFGISKYTYAMHHEETDDAQVQADISPVIPRVAGYVKEVRVKDNQDVHKGDTLLILDDRDYKLDLDKAEAALATAKSNVDAARANTNAARSGIASSRAGVSTVDAQIAAAEIAVTRTTQDFNRYANLIQDHSITQQQYEQALAAKETAEKQLQILQQQKKQASTQTSVVASQSNATAEQIGVAQSTVKQREVEVEDAKLNLSYTIITAAEDGKVSKVNVQEGQFLQAGQPVFSIVHNTSIWVVANFKETQYKKMQVGQRVTVHVDAFPKHDFEATLSSFSPATGAEFALLPPDNASGNFVKVVQRLPVKIEFVNKGDTLLNRLKAGMNVSVDVHLN